MRNDLLEPGDMFMSLVGDVGTQSILGSLNSVSVDGLVVEICVPKLFGTIVVVWRGFFCIFFFVSTSDQHHAFFQFVWLEQPCLRLDHRLVGPIGSCCVAAPTPETHAPVF